MIKQIKQKIAQTSAKHLVTIAEKGAKSWCIGPWYEPKVPSELKPKK